jgi:hypothetical protein
MHRFHPRSTGREPALRLIGKRVWEARLVVMDSIRANAEERTFRYDMPIDNQGLVVLWILASPQRPRDWGRHAHRLVDARPKIMAARQLRPALDLLRTCESRTNFVGQLLVALGIPRQVKAGGARGRRCGVGAYMLLSQLYRIRRRAGYRHHLPATRRK